MKNIETILSEVEGIELTDEQKKSIVDAVNENYKTVNDWQKQVDKVNNLTQQLTTTKDELKKFDGVDADDLKNQIADLQKKLKDADDELQTKLADRDFNDLVKDAIQKANSGHPGLPLGAAPMAYTLWADIMTHNPKDPKWENRDRFILSAGHGSMLLYSLLL